MAFTANNDVNFLTSADTGTVGAGLGDDIYVLSASVIGANKKITISDTQGANTLQLVGGLQIASSKVAANTVILTLTNGAEVTILGASSFGFVTGGEVGTGTGGVSQNYTTFVTASLGLAAVPTSGVVDGTAVTVNTTGGTSAGATGGSATYTLDASAATVIEGQSLTFTVTRTGDLTAEKTLTFNTIGDTNSGSVAAATAGTDTSPASGNVTFAAGAATATFTVAANTDSATEGLEGLKISLFDGTAVVGSKIVLVQDDPNAVQTGQTFTLTTGTDSFTSTGTTSDTFEATVGRLTANDYLNGAGGNDVLNAGLNSSGADTAIIENIETLNIQTYGASELSGALISGATAVNVTGNAVLTYTEVDGESFSLSGAGAGLTATLATAKESATNAITIDLKSGALGTVTLGNYDVSAATGGDFDQITLNASGATSVTLVEGGSGAGTGVFTATGETITVTGASDLVLTIDDAALGAASGGSGGAEATLTATAHTGVLTLDVGALADDFVLDLSKVTGVDVLRTGFASGGVVNGLTSGMTVHVDAVNNAADDLTLSVDGTATTDAITLKLHHGTDGTSVAFDDLTVTGIETTTINSTGTNTATATVSNSIGQVIGTAGSALVLGGDKALTITQIDNEFTNISVTNSVGADITLEATSAVTVTGGAGNDRVEFDTVADIGTGDSVVGGNGTDTLAFSAVIGTDLSSTQRGLISGFEVLEYEGAQDLSGATGGVVTATIDLTAEGFTTLFINGTLTTETQSGASADQTLTVTAASGNTIKIGASTTASGDAASEFIVNVTNAGNAGTNDTVNLQLVDAPSGDYSFGGLTINDVENVTLALLGDEASGDVVTVADINGAQLQTITISSANTGKNTDGTTKVSDSLTITDVESTLLNNVDASTFTGALTITGLANNLIGTGATVKGGSGVDAITGGAGGDTIYANGGHDDLSGGDGADYIDGGAGNDDIEGDAGNDNLIGGAGNDVITGGAGNDTLTLGDGNDIVEFGTGSTDTVTDFVFGATGGDIIDLSAAGNDAAVDLLDDTDGTAKVVAATSTDALVIADNEVLFVSVADIASLDTKAEIAALFGASKAFEAFAASEEATLLIRDTTTSKVYVYDLAEGDASAGIGDTADTVELIGILNNISATAFDGAVVGNFQQ